MRSRAVSLPSAFCRSRRCSPPPNSAARFSSMRRSMRLEAVTLATTRLFDDGNLSQIFQELSDAFIRQRMLHELIEYLRRHGADIGADKARLHNMDGMANRRDEDFGLEFVVVEDRHDRFDQL